MVRWPKGWLQSPRIFLKFFTKNKKLKTYGQYGKFWIQLIKLKTKNRTLGGGLQKLKL
jgi:hypothetical protein